MSEPLVVEPNAGWTRRRVIFLALSGALLVALLYAVREVLLPFILATVVAYVLTPLVQQVERRRLPRSLSIILVYTVTISIIYLGVRSIAPRLYAETSKLVRDAPALGREFSSNWAPKVDAWVQGLIDRGPNQNAPTPAEDRPAFEILRRPSGDFAVELGEGVEVIQEGTGRWRVVPIEAPHGFSVSALLSEGINRFFSYMKSNALELLHFGQLIISKIIRSIFLVFMTLMVAGYMMHTRDQILAFFRSLPPPRARPNFERLLVRIDRGLAGVVRGQLLICGVNGVLSAIGFWMFGLKYWLSLAMVAALMSIIPIFGSILSSVPVVIVAMTQNFWTALWVLLWIIGIHQIEANVLNPKIIGASAKIHPILVVFALVVGENFFGLWGALFAVPALTIVQSVFNHFRLESMPDTEADGLPAETRVRL